MAIERIQLRRGTTVEWNDANPVLAFGEPGVEVKTDTTLSVKIGDGSSTWSALPYFGELEGDFVTPTELSTELSSYSTTSQMNSAINTSVSAGLAGLVDSAPNTLDTLNELAAALGDDPNFATTITTSIGDLETAVAGKSDSGHTHTSEELNWSVYATFADLPDASTKHGMVAHVHDEGALYYAHAGAWVLLAKADHTHNASEIVNSVDEITASTYTIQASDNGKTLVLNPSGGSITVTIDNVLSVGDRIDLYLRGTSATFSAGTGTIESAGTSMATQYTVASIACVATGIYAIVGSVE